LYFIADGKIQNFVTPGPRGYVSAILLENNRLWIAKDGVIYYRENNKWDTLRFALPPEQKQPNISRIFRDIDGMMWVTTNVGLFKIDHGLLVDHPVNEVPLSLIPVISSVTADRSGAIWLGTNSGVTRVDGADIQHFNKANGLSDNSFSEMFTDNDGDVWM